MSVVWNLYNKFNDDNGNYAECTICEKKLRIPISKTTTNLLGHLSEHHKRELDRIRDEKKAKEQQKRPSSQPSIRTAFLPKINPETRKAANVDLAMLLADSSLS